ncbi:MAG: nucleic acid-binding protein [Treponema sp.]|jgi:predicted  nucleic acid-binding Zn-ribbon protein|nr:nucleic acid-binding protein [Treponema sp.]MBR6296449.1 nucleic acid-binding protein [Treponema sp.]
MQMSKIKECLENLQDVLAQKYDYEKQVEELPRNFENKKEILETMERSFFEKKTEYEAQKAKVLALRAEYDTAERTKEAGEKSMDEITNHRDFEILEKQINDAKAKSDEIKGKLHNEERRLEELNDSLTRETEIIDDTKKENAEFEAELNAKLSEFNEKIVKLSEEEKSISEIIADDEVVSKFQRIIKRNAHGIVALRGTVCTGCNMMLPKQFSNNVRHSFDQDDGNIFFCPYCSRVLYYERADDEEDEMEASLGEAGSLAEALEEYEKDNSDSDSADHDGEGNGGDDGYSY